MAAGTATAMRVVVFGATGNVGSALVRALDQDAQIDSIVGVARRLPMGPTGPTPSPKVSWVTRDISRDTLDVVDGADAVVHLAWKIQPSRDEEVMRATNVVGSRRLADAVAAHRVPCFVYASSVGTYAPHSKDGRADEFWPATGIATSTYSRHKAAVEAMLDSFEQAHPDVRVVRMRTSLVFQRSAASEVHRLFLGRLLPWHLPSPLRVVPNIRNLEFQATHADDVADAYRRAIVGNASGAFNVAAEPVLGAKSIAAAVGTRTVRVPAVLARGAAAATFHLHVHPSEPGWFDMAVQTPLMDCSRVRHELGWIPHMSSIEALCELLEGIGSGAGDATFPLHPRHMAAIASASPERSTVRV